jgi:hypothetical protein
MLVALLTADNVDRISVFKIMRLMLPGCALCSPIVSFLTGICADGDELFHSVVFPSFDED